MGFSIPSRLATQSHSVSSAAASRLFRDFTPSDEGPHQTRQPLVTGDSIQELRRRRDMLEAMTPQQAFDAIEWHNGLNFFEAVALANETGRLMASNLVIDDILIELRLNIQFVRTGTLVIYEAPDKPVGTEVSYANLRFSVPSKFRGKQTVS